eukprot:g249.t1
MKNLRHAVDAAYDNARPLTTGKEASYIPELALVQPDQFGIALCTVDGRIIEKGDSRSPFAMESISKLFTLAKAVSDFGTDTVFEKVGMHGSFLPFNSVVAAALSPTHTINPFVNQGAMATTSLLYQGSGAKLKKAVLDNLSAYAGRQLEVGKRVYASESETNATNMGLAYLLKSKNRFYGPVSPCVDAYTYQCSTMVKAADLAVMAATLASGGVHPRTKRRLIDPEATNYILQNVLPEGLYEYSDTWIMRTGGRAYAKSGVGGGVLIVIPNLCGIGVFSPRLDQHGNSVRGIAAGVELAKTLAPPLFAENCSSAAPKLSQDSDALLKNKTSQDSDAVLKNKTS